MSCINCFESSDHNGLTVALECWQVHLLAFLLLLEDELCACVVAGLDIIFFFFLQITYVFISRL